MRLALVLALLQQPATPPGFPITQIEITPATAAVEVGQKIQLAARALDASGQPVAGAVVHWFVASTDGSVDSTGLVTGGYAGAVRVAAVAALPGQLGQKIEFALVHVLPEAPARIVVEPAPTRVLAGTHLTLVGTAFSQHGDRRGDLVSFSSSNARIVAVTPEGRLHAVASGRASVTVKAGSAITRLALQVVPNTLAKLAIEPASSAVRSGDVVRLSVRASDRAGRPLADLPVEWAVTATGPAGVAEIDPQGTFVAETPGIYTVTATLGERTADAMVRVEQRRVTRGISVLAHVPIKYRTAEGWVHPAGRCFYMSTIADRVYAFDIRDVTHPRIVDSMVTDARIVNDVMTTEDGEVRCVLARGGLEPQERHRRVRRERRVPSQTDRRVHGDGLGRRAQLVRVPRARVHHR